MKVRELIKELADQPMDAEVYVPISSELYEGGGVKVDEIDIKLSYRHVVYLKTNVLVERFDR